MVFSRQKQVYVLMLFAMFSIFMPKVNAQRSCASPLYLGSLKDSTYNLHIAYPDTVRWYSFVCDSSYIRMYFGSDTVLGQRVKIKNYNIFYNCSTNLTNNIAKTFPGNPSDYHQDTISSTHLYYIRIERYYDLTTGIADTANKNIKMEIFKEQRASMANCSIACGNMVPNPGFECAFCSTDPLYYNYSFPLLFNWQRGYTTDQPEFFSHCLPPANPFYAPFFSVNGRAFNLSSDVNYPTYFPVTNDGFVGLKTNETNSYIITVDFGAPLTMGELYYVSYEVTPGIAYSQYHDRVDLDVSGTTPYSYTNYANSTFTDYDPLHIPTVQSGAVVYNPSPVWSIRQQVFMATASNQQYIYIGNLAKIPYNPLATVAGTPGLIDCQFDFIDNIFLKEFVLELGDDIYCYVPPTALTLGSDCYYPGAEYQWSIGGVPITGAMSSTYSPTPSTTTTYTLTITVHDPTGALVGNLTDSVTVNMFNSNCDTLGLLYTGMPANTAVPLPLLLFPNPNDGDFSIRYDPPTNTGALIKIFDLNGALVYTQKIPPWSTLQNLQLHELLKPGMYALSVQNGMRSGMIKFVVR